MRVSTVSRGAREPLASGSPQWMRPAVLTAAGIPAGD